MGKREALTYHDLATIIRLRKCGLLDSLEDFSTKDAVEATGRMLTASQQRIIVGQAARLIEEVITRGGTKEDLLDAIKYGLCCLDAQKYGLDLDDAQIKFRYQELYSKYMLKEEKA
jgi:hypothetical protein